MLLTVRREPSKNGATLGTLYADGVKECECLEDEIRESKVPGKTAIPPYKGEPPKKYRVALTYSPRFKKVLPEILGVKDFTAVRIHAGNTQHDTEGCLIVGEERGPDRVLRSREAMLELMALLTACIDAGEQVWIEFENPE